MFFRTFLIILCQYVIHWFQNKFFPMSDDTRKHLVSVLYGTAAMVFAQYVFNACQKSSLMAAFVATILLLLSFVVTK